MLVPELDSFYLVGGTALALQLGHRKSIDLDLFTTHSFSSEIILNSIISRFSVQIEMEQSAMIVSSIDGVKVDFVKMGYPILFPPLVIEGVRMLDIKDIAPMKLKAIAQRGSKKDFFDIYFLLQQLSLDEMLHLFQQKFSMYEVFHIIKSLTYFEDAEHSPNPVLFDPSITWPKVKATIEKGVSKLS